MIPENLRRKIAESANGAAREAVAEAVEIAIAMLDKAQREGCGEPEAKVSAAVVLRYFGGEWQFEADARAERKDVEKVDQVSTSFNPNQPELFSTPQG